jgi:hypothetical protein
LTEPRPKILNCFCTLSIQAGRSGAENFKPATSDEILISSLPATPSTPIQREAGMSVVLMLLLSAGKEKKIYVSLLQSTFSQQTDAFFPDQI